MQGVGAFLCRDAYIGQEFSLAYQQVMVTKRSSVFIAFGFDLLCLIQLS